MNRLTSLPKITRGQLIGLGSYALMLVTGINTLLGQAQTAHLPLPLWVSALAVPAIAGAKLLLTRSLDRAKSGTGQGLVGEPEVETVTLPQIVAVAEKKVEAALPPSLASQLTPIVSALNEADLHTVIADAGELFVAAHRQAATGKTQDLNRTHLLTDLAAKAEEVVAKIETPAQAPVPAVEAVPVALPAAVIVQGAPVAESGSIAAVNAVNQADRILPRPPLGGQ